MNSHPETNRPRTTRAMLDVVASVGLLVALCGSFARAQTRVESLERPDGQRVSGRLAGDVRSGFSFIPSQSSAPVPLEMGSSIHLNGTGPNSLISAPPFRVLIGQSLRVSGSLRGITDSNVRFGLGWENRELTMARPGVQAIVQRHGESQVLVDGFEQLDAARWSITGKAEVVSEPHLTDKHSLRLPAGGGAVVHKLSEPLASGRFDVAFHDEGAVVPGQQWSIELTFQGTAGLSPVRVALGWCEESLAVESPSGLAVQRLARTPGWHRFSLRFGPAQTEASVDGKELAHGKGPYGPLVAIRLASPPSAPAAPAKALAGHFDDLQLIRFAEPPASLELDVTQDEARLVVGDQLFGTIRQADGERISMTVDSEPVSLPWSEVAGVYFRRVPAANSAVDGLLARVEWRSAPDGDRDNIDFAEGAITDVSDRSITMAMPYVGVMSIPVELVRKITVQGQGRRIIIDPAAHHLGDEYSTTSPLDPPQPEGAALERTLELTTVPDSPCFVVTDVVQLVGENSGYPAFSRQIRAGELRTYLAINGKRIDYLNRHLKTDNLAPERIAIEVPAGLLHPGKNSIRLELTMSTEDKQLDDFGLLQLAVEFRSTRRVAPAPPHEPGHP